MMFNLHRFTLRSGLIGGAVLVGVWSALVAGCASKESEPEQNNAGEGGDPGEGEQGGAGGTESATGGAGAPGNPDSGGAGGKVVTPPLGGSGGNAGAAGSPAATGGSGGSPMGAAGATGAGGCKTNKVCDDFESYPAGPFTNANGWTVKGTGLVVDESKAFSGKRSIKISVANAGKGDEKTPNEAMLGRSDRTVLGTGKSVYARMMVFLDAVPTGLPGLHWALMRAIGFHSQDGKSALLTHSLGGQPGNLRNLMLWHTGTAGLQDCFNDDSKPIPVNRWLCVEWHLNPEAQAMEVWFDGQKQGVNSWENSPPGGRCVNDQTGKWVIPKLSIMDFGYKGYRDGTGGNIWVDDIAMDTARINCPTK